MKNSITLLLGTLLCSSVFAQVPALFKDINPTGDANPKGMTVIGTNFYFWADDGTSGTELWKSDGTPSGTVLLNDINPLGEQSPNFSMFGFNNELYFCADDGITNEDLWKSDGTSAGTALFKDLNPNTSGATSAMVGGYTIFS